MIKHMAYLKPLSLKDGLGAFFMRFSHISPIKLQGFNPLKIEDRYSEKYERFLQRLREARIESGLTQEEAANLLGKPQYFVSRSETGERRVDVVELEAFAAIYQKPIAYFFSLF